MKDKNASGECAAVRVGSRSVSLSLFLSWTRKGYLFFLPEYTNEYW
jgi:hypothetical protein